MKVEQSNIPPVLDARSCGGALSPRLGVSRGGSALLIVIGTLALMSVFAAVYISVGRTDRRAANAVKARNTQENAAQSFGEALSTVIGNDRLDAFVQWNGVDTQDPFGRREVTDAPYTDWTRRSESFFVDGHDLFTPVGGPFSTQDLNQGDDFSVASDPWLASTTPVYLGNPGDASTGFTERPFSTYLPFDTNYPNAKNFLDNRDWLQISNFAPDGRFVNLVNLRPNRYSGFDGAVDGDIGGFGAQSGTGVSVDPVDGRRIRRMSNYLSLWKMSNPTDPESLIQAFDPVVEGVWIPGQNAPVILSGLDVPNTPAVWTMYQRFMYMPMNQPFQTLNRNGVVSGWADPDYPPYQYADADGDGMADSRWFELTAARDANQGASNEPRTDIEVLYDRQDYRYFLAARAVDLSSMVNVNTATDLLVPPTREFPLGLTPADIDLRRLLTMQDAAGDYTANNTHNLPLSYAQLHRPYIGEVGVEPRFGPWRPDQATGWQQRNLNRNVTDYWLYKHEYDRAAPPGSGDLRDLESNSTSMLVGRYAYDALRQGIMLGSSLSGAYEGFDYAYQTPSSRQHLLQYERDPSDIGMVPARITPERRVEQYRQVGQLDPTNLGTSWARGTDFGSGLYGMDDLVELLTFHGLNDPEITTRLEKVTTGRYMSPNGDVLQTQRLGPLMSNRPLSLDRQQHGMALINPTNDPSTPPSATDRELRAPNGRISFNSMAHNALTPRNKLTTISGSVPLVPTDWVDDPSDPVALTQGSAAPALEGMLSNAGQLFGMFSRALAGELHTPDNFFANSAYWPTDVNTDQDQLTSTLFYGHRGPELALRIAAHASANTVDMLDRDTEPTIATLVVDANDRGQAARDYFSNNLASGGSFDPVNDPEYALYPGLADGNLFDPGANVLTSGSLPDKRQVVNVYGFEAMPVITEVSVLYAYTDASDQGGGGDKDYGDTTPIVRNFAGELRVIYPPREEIEEISINGDVSPGNADFLIQVLAFQLHNPYDQDISLGGADYGGTPLGANEPLTRQRAYQNEENAIDPASNYQFDYYIEFAGRFFKLAKYIEWYPTVNNAENYTLTDVSSVAYTSGSVPNPAVDFPGGNARMDPGTQTSAGATPGDYAAQASYSDFITRNVVLRAGETRVFYVIADKRFDDATPGILTDGTNPDDRWARLLDAWEAGIPAGFTNLVPSNDLDLDGLPDGPYGDSRGWTGPAEQWVEHQFRVMTGGTGVDPVMMMEFDPRDGKLLNETNFEDLTTPSASPLFPAPILGRQDALEVRLWKKIVTRGEETVEPSSTDLPNPTMRNLVENDLLVDRMVLGESLASPIASGSFRIADTVSYREDFPVTGSVMDTMGVRNDNTGVTIAAWKTNRRADSDTQEMPSVGEVVPWMLRSSNAPATTRQSLVSDILGTPVASDIFEGDDLADPAESVTIAGDFEITQSLLGFFNLSSARGANAIIQTIALAPHLKSDVTAQVFIEDDAANESLRKFPPLILTVQDPANGIVPEIMVNGSTIRNAPRLADLLLAWGIGPAFSPNPVRANKLDYVPEEWMTGPESMATALGVNVPNPTGPLFDDIDSIWKDTYDLAIGDVVLDNGHLAIDNYVSYVNTDLNVPPTFDPVVDIPRGTGVPMALGVIDHARAIAPIAQVSDPTAPTPEQLLKMTLGRATFGTVNINTAPIEVLRLLPGLTPSRASYISGGTAVNEWWGKDFASTGLPRLTNPTLGSGTVDDLAENPDVAAAIIAYRDRTYGIPNTAARPEPYGLTFYDNAPMNLEPTDPQLFANNMRGEFPLTPTMNNPADRSAMTGIDGLRPTPGFGSLGELLAVRIDPNFEATDLARWNTLRHLSIQQYGFDNEASGIESNVTIMSQLFGGTSTGTTEDDYAEKISMANAVLNTISVRSDYFAVWFVLHGYQESDVKNLRLEDPLVPSIRKRFLMVVDRTNVIEPGDKPNILVFKELPY